MPGVPMTGLKLGGRSRKEMKKGRRGKRSVRVGGAEEEKCSAQGLGYSESEGILVAMIQAPHGPG